MLKRRKVEGLLRRQPPTLLVLDNAETVRDGALPAPLFLPIMNLRRLGYQPW
jgi:hypothetical protein